MKVKLTVESWDGILDLMKEVNALLDHGYIHPKEVSEYLSEQVTQIDMNKMKIITEQTT